MKYIIIPLLFLTTSVWSQQIDSVSLDQCYASAIKNHPWTSQLNYYQTLENVNNKTIAAAWYPTITLNGQATWQNDVTKINIPANIPLKISPMPNDQFKATVDLRENIYDGGLTKSRKRQESSDLLVNQQSVVVEISKVRESINSIYFAYLLNNKLLKQFITLELSLDTQRVSVVSSVKNGIALPTDIDEIDAELLSYKQKISEFELSKQAAINMLCMLTQDSSILKVKGLETPHLFLPEKTEIKRDELKLFDLQQQRMDANIGAINATVKPKLFAFSSLGYGDPGLNMFKSGWQPIGIVGVGLSWNVVDWGKANRDKQSIVIQKMVVDTKKADFVRGITVSMENQKAEIEKLRSQLENDTKLVTLRKRITNVSAKQMNEGTATVFAYLSQLTKEKDAIVLRELHQAQLQKAIADYLYMRGN